MAIGDPTGADLASGTTDGNTLGLVASPTLREVSIDSPIELTSGVKYAIILSVSAADATNYVAWWRGDNDYANGLALWSVDSGSSWTQFPTQDLWFITKATGASKDENQHSGTGTIVPKGAFNELAGQSFTASSTYTITSIVLKLSRYGSPGNATVSIRATEGVPTKAKTPSPATTATNVTLDQATITWEDGGGANTFDVYYGTESGNLGDAVSSAQAGTSLTITGITSGSPFDYLIVRYWRIDSTNAAGTTTGDEWVFTTIRADAPKVTYWYNNEYYQLLIDADGVYGDHPADGGVEDTDYVVVAYEPNVVRTNKKLVACANDKVWFEDTI